MNRIELIWRERTPELESIDSVWTSRAAVIMERIVPANPCISIILVKSEDSAEVIIRGPETKPHSEILLPDYTWIGIRLQPGVRLKNFPTQQLTDKFRTLPTDNNGQFEYEGTLLQFPDFNNAEQLIKQMNDLGYISGKALNSQESPQQSMSSKSYSRFIKQNTGLSPYKLHQLQRISEALGLLRRGTPAATVASELGFTDQAHLTHAAKQFLGHTPKELLRWPHRPSKASKIYNNNRVQPRRLKSNILNNEERIVQMPKVVTFLWFEGPIEEAVNLYVSLFKDAKITHTSRLTEVVAKAVGLEAGTVQSMDFELNGQRFCALMGGPMYKLTEAASIQVHCKDQAEIDKFWEALSEGGKEMSCGWITDKWGLTWQIMPDNLDDMMRDSDAAKANRVSDALLSMEGKLDKAELEKAYRGE